jgi:hypothetical protein
LKVTVAAHGEEPFSLVFLMPVATTGGPGGLGGLISRLYAPLFGQSWPTALTRIVVRHLCGLTIARTAVVLTGAIAGAVAGIARTTAAVVRTAGDTDSRPTDERVTAR